MTYKELQRIILRKIDQRLAENGITSTVLQSPENPLPISYNALKALRRGTPAKIETLEALAEWINYKIDYKLLGNNK